VPKQGQTSDLVRGLTSHSLWPILLSYTVRGCTCNFAYALRITTTEMRERNLKCVKYAKNMRKRDPCDDDDNCDDDGFYL